MENNYGHVNRDTLYELYVNQKKSCRTIAKELGCGKTLVNKRLRKYNIKLRKKVDIEAFTPKERKEKYGLHRETHHKWKGGKTNINNILRNKLNWVSKERLIKDNYTCSECGVSSNVIVHHKIPFSVIVDDILKENNNLSLQKDKDRETLVQICENDKRLQDIENLITLCESCHINYHTKNPVKILKFDIIEKDRQHFIKENHYNMSVSYMGKILNIRPYRIIRFMKENNLKFSYENKEWLQERLKEKSCSLIAREFNSLQFRCYAYEIRSIAYKFGLIKYKGHVNDLKT